LETPLGGRYDYTNPLRVPPSGGSLEIGNIRGSALPGKKVEVPPSGGSLEIGNSTVVHGGSSNTVPPSGGSLEIGNIKLFFQVLCYDAEQFPLRGDP